MKKTIFSVIALAVLCISGACNKIEEDDYLIYAGSSGEWVDGKPVSNHQKCVLLEKYTAVKCTNCPAADELISGLQATYGEQLVVYAIHATSMASPFQDTLDMRTPDGDIWDEAFGVQALPKAMVNRKSQDGQFIQLAPAEMSNSVENALAEEPVLAMSMKSDYNAENRRINITASLEFLKDVSDSLHLTMVLMEDSLVGKQLLNSGWVDGYVFNHVLRDVITDVWGLGVKAKGQAGECREITLRYILPKKCKPQNCHVVAFVSKQADKEILQCAETDVTK